MIVELTWREVRLAVFAATERQIFNIHQRRVNRHGLVDSQDWDVHIQGVLGEFVVCKHLGLYWTGAIPANETAGDAGRHQVRATTRSAGCLIVHPEDPDDVPFVLVTGTAPTFRIAGWITGGDAKQTQWWRTDVRNAAYFVPQAALRSIDEFVEVPR